MSNTMTPGATILDKYKIVSLLGEGGMARVWLAEEITFGNRQVAIKEPRPDLPAAELDDLRLRYEREVQVCAALEKVNAPHTVRAITADPYSGSVLLIMEYLVGGDVHGLIGKSASGLPVDRAVSIAVAVLGALHAAHNHPWEIVHRDIKPSNILLDGQGNARLGDWGLAQRTNMSGRTQLLAGAHPGTPGYMAPEQRNSSEPLSAAADIYALGCVLFEMLTGKRYHRVKPGSTAGSLRGEVPGWLDAVLAKALAADAWERYQSAEEMQAALAGQVAGGKLQGAGGGSIPAPHSPVLDPPAEPAQSQPRRGGFWQWLFGSEETKSEPMQSAAPAKPLDTPKRTASAPVANQARKQREDGVTPAQSPRIDVNSQVPPFVFRNGKQARSLAELVTLCVDNPIDGMWHLEAGQFEPWLEMVLKDKKLTQLSQQLRQQKLGGPARLKAFLDAAGPGHSYRPELTVAFRWVTIPAGPFWMGSDPARDQQAQDAEKPHHLVEVAAFRIARVPVTNAQFQVFVNATGHRTTAEEQGSAYVRNQKIGQKQIWEEVKGAYWASPGSSIAQKMDHPVVCISWHDALAFCTWAGVRLPTEAEWEKAARGVDGRLYPWGYETPDKDRGNFGNMVQGTTPVGNYLKGASPFGVLDMAGNVWEWTSSQYKPYPYKVDDGRENLKAAGSEGRVVRGGSFDDVERFVRCANRYWYLEDLRNDIVGFRVVAPGF